MEAVRGPVGGGGNKGGMTELFSSTFEVALSRFFSSVLPRPLPPPSPP